MKIVDGGLQADPPTGAFRNALDDLGDGRRFRYSRKLVRQVLLQRLTSGLSAALETRMDMGGKISNQHIWHAFIMLAPVRIRKSTER